MQSFFSFMVNRPVAITMMVTAAVVFGFVGFSRLPVNLLPKVNYPKVTIRTEYPGASPQDVEERVSERIQESVAVISGARRVISISRPGISDVILEFTWGTQMVFAVSDIQERLSRVLLPEQAERPLVLRYDPSLDPVMTLGLVSTGSQVALRRLAELEIEESLSVLDGVAAVKVRGGEEEEVRIIVDEQALTLYGIRIQDIGARLAAENLNVAAGLIEEGKTEYLVRALNEFQDLDELRQVILERRENVSIRIQDVARVERVSKDREVISRINGEPCVLVDLFKEANANVVELCQGIRDRCFGSARQQAYVQKELATYLAEKAEQDAGDEDPDKEEKKERSKKRLEHQVMTNYLAMQLQDTGVQLNLLQDQSRFIEDAVDDVLDSATLGGLFALLVIYLFLRRIRAAMILFVSIPLSLVATFAPMFMSGIDLNIMSLGGLALGVGMLVDNSIVVLESITRAREEGHSRKQAGILGTSRVASAVVASTLTTVAVFFPIVFVEGVAGQLFHDQALTVVYALLISLLASLTVIPMLCSRGQDRGEDHGEDRGEEQKKKEAETRKPQGQAWQQFSKAYATLLATALSRKALVLTIAGLMLLAAVWRIPSLGNELLPQVSQGEIYLDCFLPRDATVERNDRVLRRVEAKVHDLTQVQSTFLAAGVDKDELNDSDQGEHSSRILINMIPHQDRAAQEVQVRQEVRQILRRFPEIQEYRFARASLLSLDTAMVVEVMGRDVIQVRRACQTVQAALQKIPGLRDVRATLQAGNTEIAIRLDREKLAALGLDTQEVTDILRSKIQGELPSLFAEREQKLDMLVRVDRQALASMQQLLELNLNPAGSPPMPLQSLASIQRREGPSEIRRIGNLRGAEVRATLQGFDLGSTQELVQQMLWDLQLPTGTTARMGSQKAELEESLHGLSMSLLLAVFLVYLVMASQFENLLQPLIILLTMPLAMVGVVLALDLLDISLSVVVLLGGIVLAGIVVNNAIIMVDQINRLRQQGMAKAEAIVRGAQIRLRPVLMTTTTTILGLLPLTGWLSSLSLPNNFLGLQDTPVLGWLLAFWNLVFASGSEGLELRAPLAITVVSGLLVSTLLTLLIIPTAYALADRRP